MKEISIKLKIKNCIRNIPDNITKEQAQNIVDIWYQNFFGLEYDNDNVYKLVKWKIVNEKK